MDNIEKKMNITLINPPVFRVIEPYYDLPNFPRTALAFLAGYLKENSQEIEVKVIDSKFDRLNFDETMELLKKNRSNIIGITAMTNEINSAAEMARRIKEFDEKITIVIGGVHATALAEDTLREFKNFDYLVSGEGESALLILLEQLMQNKEITAKGVSYLRDNEFIHNGESERVLDQDGLKPAWDMFRSAEEYMIQSSRGCPFACNFCMNPGGRVVRARTVETTLDEIGWLIENKSPKSIYFGDEIFTVNRDRAMKICNGLIERKYHEKISWWCQTHVNTIDEKLATAMKASNCSTVGLGIETGDPEKLKKMGKGTSRKKILNAINIMKEVKLEFNTFFILGQPNETYESAKNTIDFAIELNPTIPIFGLMVPYPGTEIWDMARKGEAGYKMISSDWDLYNKQIGNALELNGITRKQMEKLQLMGYVKVFIYNFRFLDFFKFLYRFRAEAVQVFKTQSLYYLNIFNSKTKNT